MVLSKEFFIFPVLVGLTLWAIDKSYTPIMEYLRPSKEITITTVPSNPIITPETLGDENLIFYNKKTNKIFLNQLSIENTGKDDLSDIELYIKEDIPKENKFRRLFYTKYPSISFDKVELNTIKPGVTKILIKKFISANKLSLNILSSEPIKTAIEINRSDISFKYDYNHQEIGKVMLMFLAAFFTVVLRLLIDITRFLVKKF